MLKKKQKTSFPTESKDSADLFLEYCKDIDKWADSWKFSNSNFGRLYNQIMLHR
jgi:hypothetical protein